MLTQARQQFLEIWKKQSTAQKAVLIGLIVAAIVLIVIFLLWANTPSYAVAFSGLSEADAGQIVQKLEELGITYQLQSGSTILVPSDKVYDVRLNMAREGLPAGGNVGLELFSGNTFGMTEFTQRVNYQRAMEGELERTIGSLAAVQAVRVHVVTPEKALLSVDQAPTTASITVQEKPGSHLDSAQVQAITHLVASSVEGLKPENVVVVDVNGNLLAAGASEGDGAAAAQNDSHRAAEVAAANELKKKVQTLLDSALGPNRSVVQANVTMDWTARETTQQTFNPDTATIRSSQLVTETYLTNGAQIGGIPGVATNLPPIAITTTTDNQGALYERHEETKNYEITSTETHETNAPGKIDRVSLSVLVDGVSDAQQLQSLQSVIAAAAGIDETRGDVLAVQSLAFDRSFYEEQAAAMDTTQKTDLYWRIGEIALAVIAMAALLWYVQRLLSNLKLASSQTWTPVLRTVSDMALPTGAQAAVERYDRPARLGLDEPVPFLGQPSENKPVEIPEPRYEAPVLSEEDEQLQRLVVHLAEENPATVADILQMWLSEDEK